MFVYVTYLVYIQLHLHYERVGYNDLQILDACAQELFSKFLDALFVVTFYIQHQENRYSEFLSVCMFQIIKFYVT